MNQEIIREMADEIKEKIRNGTLFGKPIDMENIDMILVAAYSLAKNEVLKERLDRKL